MDRTSHRVALVAILIRLTSVSTLFRRWRRQTLHDNASFLSYGTQANPNVKTIAAPVPAICR